MLKEFIAFCPSLEIGGSERVITRLATEAVSRGLAATIIIMYGPVQFELPAEIEVLRLSSFTNRPQQFARLLCLVQVLWNIILNRRRLTGRVVFCFTYWPLAVLLCTARLTNIRIIYCQRECLIFRTRKSLIGRLAVRLFSSLLRSKDKVIFQTDRQARNATSLIRHPINYHVIPNPYPSPKEFCSEPREDNQFVFGMYGRVIPRKRFENAVKALACVDSSAVLHIMGDGPSLPSVRNLIQLLKLHDRVKILPASDKVSEFLGRIDVFLLLSTMEGYPNSLQEAIAAGRAVVATDCPTGPREILCGASPLEFQLSEPLRCDVGYLIPVDSHEDLVYSMKELMCADPQSLVKIGDAGRRRAYKLSTSAVLDQFLAVSEC